MKRAASKRTRWNPARALGSALLGWLVAACTSELESRPEGKQCSDLGQRCSSGFVCDVGLNLCVRPGELRGQGGVEGLGGVGGAGGAGGDAGSGGATTGGGAGGGSGAMGGDAGFGGEPPNDGGTGPVIDAGDSGTADDADGGDAGCTPSVVFPDLDGDGFGVTGPGVLRCPGLGWASQAGDCRDDLVDVFPRQLTYFRDSFPDPTKSGGVSFDYDCTGGETPDPANSPAGQPPACAQLLICTGRGYLPASPARSGPGIEPRCGSVQLRQCVSQALTCAASDLQLAEEIAFRCK